MKKLLLILPILMLSIGCNSVRKLTGQDEHHDSAAPKPAWLAITGTWSGNYRTEKAGPFPVTVWINQMDLYDNHFTGEMNDGPMVVGSGAIDGDSVSHFSGDVNAVNKTFTMRVVSQDSTCGGTFDLSGTIVMGLDGPADLKLTGISGSNCKGTHTTIEGDL